MNIFENQGRIQNFDSEVASADEVGTSFQKDVWEPSRVKGISRGENTDGTGLGDPRSSYRKGTWVSERPVVSQWVAIWV